MTKDRLSETAALRALFSATPDAQVLAEMLGFVADRLMALDVDQLCGAGAHERSDDRMMAGLSAARARGRCGGAPYKMTAAKLRLTQAAMGNPETKVRRLCRDIGVSSQTLYRHVAPDGQLRPDGLKLLARAKP